MMLFIQDGPHTVQKFVRVLRSHYQLWLGNCVFSGGSMLVRAKDEGLLSASDMNPRDR